MMIMRDMVTADLPAVLDIEWQSFTTPWSEASFLGEIHNRNSVARVAVREETVVGYICLRVILDDGHLMDLAVHPSHRRKGIGGELFSDALGLVRLKGCRSLYLEVRLSNTPAIEFYKKLGFRHLGTRRGYYGSPHEDGAVMVLDLDEGD